MSDHLQSDVDNIADLGGLRYVSIFDISVADAFGFYAIRRRRNKDRHARNVTDIPCHAVQ
jgi:hypothetical protein